MGYYTNLMRKKTNSFIDLGKMNITIPLKTVNPGNVFSAGASFNSELLYEEIQVEIEKNQIDISIYNLCISFPISPSWINEDGTYKFLINNKPVSEYDIKLLLIAGYIYIFHKADFTINSILFLIKSNESKYLLTDNTTVDRFGSSLKLNIKANDYPELGVLLEDNYIMIPQNKSLFEVLKELNVEDKISYLYDMDIRSISIYNPNTGFSDDKSKVTIAPINIINKSTNPDDMILIFFKGDLPDNYDINKKDKSGMLFYNTLQTLRDIDNVYEFFKNDTSKWIPDNLVYYTNDYKYDRTLLMEARDFNYDLYESLYLDKYSTHLLFEGSQISYTKYPDVLAPVVKGNTELLTPGQIYAKISFTNHRKYLPEIYYKGVRYDDYKLVERKDDITTIYIKVAAFNWYYNRDLQSPDIEVIPYLFVILRPEDYIEVDYVNIYSYYNGTLPLGSTYFNLRNKRMYNNGMRMKDNEDHTINNLPPRRLVVSFPKRKYKNHRYKCTGYLHDDQYMKSYHLKYKNISNTEISNIEYNKYIYKSLFYIDYIDERFTIACGPYTLQLNKDYIIHSNTLIEFISPLYKYKEDDINSDYIDIDIWCDELTPANVEVNKFLAYKSSYKKRIFEEDFIRKGLYNVRNDLVVLNSRDDLDCPEYYREDLYRNNIYITKYLSTEVILTGVQDSYGNEWFDELQNEFPEAVITDTSIGTGVNIVQDEIYDKTIPMNLDDPVRFITLPEPYPLNTLIDEDIVAKRKIIHDNLDFVGNRMNNEYNNSFFSKEEYTKGVDITKLLLDVRYHPTIPFNAIYDER